MAVIHFLNVKQGDRSIIQHNSKHVTVIDVCNAKEDSLEPEIEEAVSKALAKDAGVLGNWRFDQGCRPPYCSASWSKT
jgi:competence protein ComEC